MDDGRCGRFADREVIERRVRGHLPPGCRVRHAHDRIDYLLTAAVHGDLYATLDTGVDLAVDCVLDLFLKISCHLTLLPAKPPRPTRPARSPSLPTHLHAAAPPP